MWKTISAEEIDRSFDEELSIPSESKFDDILSYINEIYPYIQNESGVSKSIEYEEKPSEWINFDTSFSFSHRKIIPPRHDLLTKFTTEQYDTNVHISYEYYFNHKVDIVIDKNESLSHLFRLIKSIYITQASYEWVSKKKNALKRIPIIGDLIYDIRFSKYLSTADISFSILESKSTQIAHEFQVWIESRMSKLQLFELDQSFEKYWEGTPVEYRGIRIQM
jgi:hypothetical protein